MNLNKRIECRTNTVCGEWREHEARRAALERLRAARLDPLLIENAPKSQRRWNPVLLGDDGSQFVALGVE
jgi:hypothetical protein